jgi:DNA-binding MltR family transcriptional regulator
LITVDIKLMAPAAEGPTLPVKVTFVPEFDADFLRHFEEVADFRFALNEETDRGCALMAGAFLDQELERLLEAKFVDDAAVFKRLVRADGPIGTFSSRIDLAYLLGLIGKRAQQDLHLIRKVRNEFAHKPQPTTFTADAVAARCRNFHSDGYPPNAPPRKKFTRAVLAVTAAIHSTMHSMVRSKPAEDTNLEESRAAWRKLMELLGLPVDGGQEGEEPK